MRTCSSMRRSDVEQSSGVCRHAPDNEESSSCASFKSSKEDNNRKHSPCGRKRNTACGNMVNPAELFPSEVWNHVLSYLSADEKSRVRASCAYFRELVDRPSLWRGWSVVLDFVGGSYDASFWETLRRRKVTRVVLRKSHSKHIKVVASSLPAVTVLVMDGCPRAAGCFKGFRKVRSLAVRSVYMEDLQSLSAESFRQQLTHFSLCNIPFSDILRNMSVLCQFKNLTSLVYHEKSWGIPCSKMESILAALPKLKHLSLHLHFPRTELESFQGLEPNSWQLTSLEILGRGRLLPGNAMKRMSQLKRFAVFYKVTPRGTPGNEPLSHWLSDLPDLSTLVVVKGPPVQTYVSSIPVTLTDLTLHDSKVSLEDMAAVATQIPHLQRLHLDTWPSHLGANASQIPKLFPNLKSLKIRHEHIPEKSFFDLHQLQKLEKLEIIDSHPDLPALVQRLRILTKSRLRVLIPPYQTDVLSCPCVC